MADLEVSEGGLRVGIVPVVGGEHAAELRGGKSVGDGDVIVKRIDRLRVGGALHVGAHEGDEFGGGGGPEGVVGIRPGEAGAVDLGIHDLQHGHGIRRAGGHAGLGTDVVAL